MVRFFEQRHVAADLGGGAGRLHARRARADDDDFARAGDFFVFVGFAAEQVRVHGAAQRLVAADAVADAAGVAGDAPADGVRVPAPGLARPVGVCDEPAAETDEVRVAAREDVLGDLRVADVAHRDRRLAEFFLHGARHIAAPAVRQARGVDLVLDALVERRGGIEKVDAVL